MDENRDLKSKLFRHFETFEETQQPGMTESQYLFAIAELHLGNDELEIGKRLLVYRESVEYISRMMEVDLEKILRVRAIIVQNFFNQLDKRQVKFKSYVIPKTSEAIVKRLEKTNIEQQSKPKED